MFKRNKSTFLEVITLFILLTNENVGTEQEDRKGAELGQVARKVQMDPVRTQLKASYAMVMRRSNNYSLHEGNDSNARKDPVRTQLKAAYAAVIKNSRNYFSPENLIQHKHKRGSCGVKKILVLNASLPFVNVAPPVEISGLLVDAANPQLDSLHGENEGDGVLGELPLDNIIEAQVDNVPKDENEDVVGALEEELPLDNIVEAQVDVLNDENEDAVGALEEEVPLDNIIEARVDNVPNGENEDALRELEEGVLLDNILSIANEGDLSSPKGAVARKREHPSKVMAIPLLSNITMSENDNNLNVWKHTPASDHIPSPSLVSIFCRPSS